MSVVNATKVCSGDPCNGKCLSDTEWFCEGRCIDKREPCEGRCQAEEGRPYPVLCEEENRCIGEHETCGDKCRDPDQPVWMPWSGGVCLAEEECRLPWHYMCNGICIPTTFPCNNACLEELEWAENKFEKLFGPVTCYVPMDNNFLCVEENCGSSSTIDSSDHYWTGALEPQMLNKVIDLIGHTKPQLGVCLPGTTGCNGTCPLDSERPHRWKEPERNGAIICSGETCEQCGSEFCIEGKMCDDMCIRSYEDCEEEECSHNQWFCEGHCINKREPCNGRCQAKEGKPPPYYHLLCEEENRCIGEHETCGEKCLDPEQPVWMPWREGVCLAQEECTAPWYYMCNGICIPTIFPCNNTCLEELEWAENEFEKLFGPVTCHVPITFFDMDIDYYLCAKGKCGSNTDDYWTGSLEPHLLSKVIDLIGHTEPQLGVCLPGYIGCNGTCPLDPERPHRWKETQLNGSIICSGETCEHCDSEFCMEGKLCKDMCIRNYEDCKESEEGRN